MDITQAMYKNAKKNETKISIKCKFLYAKNNFIANLTRLLTPITTNRSAVNYVITDRDT